MDAGDGLGSRAERNTRAGRMRGFGRLGGAKVPEAKAGLPEAKAGSGAGGLSGEGGKTVAERFGKLIKALEENTRLAPGVGPGHRVGPPRETLDHRAGLYRWAAVKFARALAEAEVLGVAAADPDRPGWPLRRPGRRSWANHRSGPAGPPRAAPGPRARGGWTTTRGRRRWRPRPCPIRRRSSRTCNEPAEGGPVSVGPRGRFCR